MNTHREIVILLQEDVPVQLSVFNSSAVLRGIGSVHRQFTFTSPFDPHKSKSLLASSRPRK